MNAEICDQFDVNPARFPELIADIHRQMSAGLQGAASSLQMIPSYADGATGQEEGLFMALDFGGTNLRILKLELKDHRIQNVRISGKCKINEKTEEGSVLFDQVADGIKKFLAEEGLLSVPEPLPLGFTFSFPVQQFRLNAGKLIKWTKEFVARNVEGHEVVGILQAALERAQIAHLVKVVALVNDTVGTMAAHSYEHPETVMGVIMGTGTNACYRERLSNIPKLSNAPVGPTHTIVNMEWGNYNGMPTTPFDEELFRATGTEGMQFEKMTSGRYITMLFGIVLNSRIAGHGLFAGLPTGADWKWDGKYAMDGSQLDAIAADTAPFAATRQIVLRFAGRPATDALPLSADDLAFAGALARAILRRSAVFAGIMVAAVVARLHRDSGAPAAALRTVAIDGSVFHHSPGYDRTLQDAAERALVAVGLTKEACPISVQHACDGSGVGAAIIAATAKTNPPRVFRAPLEEP